MFPSRLTFPLAWPYWRKPQRDASDRKRALFSKKGKRNAWGGRPTLPLTVLEAQERLLAELDRYTPPGKPWRIDPESITITTNLEVRKTDRRPKQNRTEPNDPSVAVYFTLDGVDVCLPCDTYDRVADNIAAIAAHVDADRTQDRHGVVSVEDRFAGNLALPAAGDTAGLKWYEYFALDRETATEADVVSAYRNLAKVLHPDARPGEEKAVAERDFTVLNAVYQQALTVVRGRTPQQLPAP